MAHIGHGSVCVEVSGDKKKLIDSNLLSCSCGARRSDNVTCQQTATGFWV